VGIEHPRRLMLLVVAFAAGGAGGLAAAAPEAKTVFAPPPSKRDLATMTAWANARASDKSWAAFSVSDHAVLMVSEKPALTAWPVVRTWIRTEYLDPESVSFPSELDYFEIDCLRKRVRLLSATFYRGTGMSEGVAEEIDTEKPQWEYPLPFTETRTVVQATCLTAQAARGQIAKDESGR